MKKSRAFSDIFAKYKHYDPSTEEPGNASEWRGAFQERMGLGEAKEVLKGQGPRAVLGVAASATWEEIKRAYRKLVLQHHPDRVPEAEKAAATLKLREVNAAFAILADEFGM